MSAPGLRLEIIVGHEIINITETGLTLIKTEIRTCPRSPSFAQPVHGSAQVGAWQLVPQEKTGCTMQPCFDSATGFLVTFALICSRFRDLKKKRSFSGQFEYKVQGTVHRVTYLPSRNLAPCLHPVFLRLGLETVRSKAATVFSKDSVGLTRIIHEPHGIPYWLLFPG